MTGEIQIAIEAVQVLTACECNQKACVNRGDVSSTA